MRVAPLDSPRLGRSICRKWHHLEESKRVLTANDDVFQYMYWFISYIARAHQDGGQEENDLKSSLGNKEAEIVSLSSKLEEAKAMFASERLAFEQKV